MLEQVADNHWQAQDVNTAKLIEAVGALLRAERARANLTLREAAARAGVTYATLSRYEQAKQDKPMRLDVLYRLAAAYGVEVTAMLPPVAEVKHKAKVKK